MFAQGPWVIFTLVVEILGITWYIRSVAILRSRNRKWSKYRIISGISGFVSLAIAFQSGVPIYAGSIFTIHIIQHLILMIGAPILLAISAPVTLAMQTLPYKKKVILLKVVKSRWFRIFTNPLVAIVGNNGIMFWFFLGHGLAFVMPRPPLMDLVNILFLVFGFFGWWSVSSPDYIGRRRFPHPVRVILGASGMPFDAFLAIALLPGGASVSIAPDMYSLNSIQTGAAVFWVAIMLISGFGLAIPLLEWMRGERRRDIRGDKILINSHQVVPVSKYGWWEENVEVDSDGFIKVPWSNDR